MRERTPATLAGTMLVFALVAGYAPPTTTRRAFLARSAATAVAAPATIAWYVNAEPASAAAVSGTEAAAATAATTAAGVDARTEFISGLIAGAAQKTAKGIVLHPLDTIKTRLQLKGGSQRSLLDAELYKQLYSGVGPAIVSGAPAASVFFAVKDTLKQSLKPQLGAGVLTTLVAVGGANIPYWVIRNPTEVIKARRQAGQVVDATSASQELWDEQGVGGFYRGYVSNIAYAYPVDASKFVIFDAIKAAVKERNGGKKLSPVEAAVYGAFASSCAQGLATPLDVARTRIMTAPSDQPAQAVPTVIREVWDTEGAAGIFAGLTPKFTRAVVSGALQFSVLESVKDVVNDALLNLAAPRGTARSG